MPNKLIFKPIKKNIWQCGDWKIKQLPNGWHALYHKNELLAGCESFDRIVEKAQEFYDKAVKLLFLKAGKSNAGSD